MIRMMKSPDFYAEDKRWLIQARTYYSSPLKPLYWCEKSGWEADISKATTYIVGELYATNLSIHLQIPSGYDEIILVKYWKEWVPVIRVEE